MGFFPDVEVLIQEFIAILLEQYGPLVALGLYILAVMAIGTITLTVVIIYLSIKTPIDLVKKMLNKGADD